MYEEHDGLVLGLRVSESEVRTTVRMGSSKPAGGETHVTTWAAIDARVVEPRSCQPLRRRTVPTLPPNGAAADAETPPARGRTSG